MTSAARPLTLTKFRHSCLLIEVGDARLLLDPGVFSTGFEGLTDLAAVLITHQHPDHLDAGRLGALLAANPGAQVFADHASAAQLADAGISATAVTAGQQVSAAGVPIGVYGGEHAQIAPGVPVPPNVGYAVDGRFAYSGDAYASPPEPVQTLAIPTAAPWLLAAECVGFLQRQRPESVVPVHEAMLAMTGVYYGLYQRFAEEQGTAFRVIDDGQPAAF
jgi:L-ascorbate metabolism protein UlaG (beta-lactamase superfamily)